MGLKIIENFDSSFSLDPEVKTVLFELLRSEALPYDQVEFTELLFQAHSLHDRSAQRNARRV